MSTFFRLFLLNFLLFSAPVFGKENFTYEQYKLSNGLQVVIIPNHRAPVVYHSIWYKVGSADSPLDKSGLAHFLEHLMFKGTTKFPGDKFKRIVNDLGGDQNATTTWDRTVYYVTIAKEYLPKVMELEADRMQNLVLKKDDIEKERDVVLQERRSVVDAKPEAHLTEAVNADFFWQHPYGKPVIGFEEHIRQYTREDAMQFYKKWYNPNNAILVIAGDVDVKTIKPLIQKYYGSLAAPPLPKRERLNEPTHRGVRTKIEMKHPQVNSMLLERIYRAPNFKTAGPKKEAALTLLQDILGDATDGRLTINLVEKHKLAHFAVANYVGNFYDPYNFTITASPINSSDLDLLDASIEAQVRRLINEGVTEEELNTAKNMLIYENLYRHDSINGLADYFGENLAHGYTFKDLETWPDIIKSVTREDILEVAKEILSNGPEIVAVAYPVAPK